MALPEAYQMAQSRPLLAHFAPLVPPLGVRHPSGPRGAAVAVCPKTPLRGLLQPTDFTMVDIGETAGPQTYVFRELRICLALQSRQETTISSGALCRSILIVCVFSTFETS